MSEINSLKAQNSAMYKALKLLLGAKKLKNTKGKTPAYRQMALEAWQAAEDALYLADTLGRSEIDK